MDRNAFADIVLDATDSLYHISKSILRNDADCEDAVQEAIVIAFGKLHTLRQEQYAKTWLTRILINECYNILKKQKRTVPMPAEAQDLYPTAEGTDWYGEDYSVLYQALMLLNKEYRLTIVLHYLEGYSIEEVARIMHTGAGTVKSRLHRGRARLRDILKEEMDYGIVS